MDKYMTSDMNLNVYTLLITTGYVHIHILFINQDNQACYTKS